MSAQPSVRGGVLHQSEVLDLARRRAEPAVSVLAPIGQPAFTHPETAGRLRALMQRAIDATTAWWGADVAEQVAANLDLSAVEADLAGRPARGVAVLATAKDCHVLLLPFAVDEQVVVDDSFATRQLFEGIARHPRHRVLVLDGHRARLYEGQGRHLAEVVGHGFPIEVDPPHEQDSPHRDLPIHENAAREEHRIVYRAVDDALDAANGVRRLPVVVTAAERELALFGEVTRHADLVVGRVSGNYAHIGPDELVDVVEPVLQAHREDEQHRVVEHLREAHGREHAVGGLEAVEAAAAEGRGHLLVVEEGFTFPRHWVDGLAAEVEPEPQLEIDDAVDDLIETVLLEGGQVEFVPDGALTAFDHVGLLLRF